MFEYLNGKIVELMPAYAVLDVNGIGYFVRISMFTYEKIQGSNEAKLHVEFIVREDGHYLYGFYDKEERELFRHLISVSGIGSGSAMMLLSALNPAQLTEAIVHEDVGILKSVKGIGPKTAKRLIVELKDKIMKHYQLAETEAPAGGRIADEAATALEVLGYPRKITVKVIRQILKENPAMNVEQIIKTALKRL